MLGEQSLPARNFFQVIDAIIEAVPEGHTLRKQLEEIRLESEFRAPERMYVSWEHLEQFVNAHTRNPHMEWQYMVIAILSNRTVDTVREVLGPKKGK